jgi:hypothetical protein
LVANKKKGELMPALFASLLVVMKALIVAEATAAYGWWIVPIGRVATMNVRDPADLSPSPRIIG